MISRAAVLAGVTRPPMVHIVKCIQPFFGYVWDGSKTFEIRKDDRDYQPDDVLAQREFDGRFYRDRIHTMRIGYVLRDSAFLKRNWCAFSLLEPTEAEIAMADAALEEAGAI